MTDSVQVEVERGAEAVTVFVDGEAVGTADPDWWREWAASIDGDPESCLAACLAAEGSPVRSR